MIRLLFVVLFTCLTAFSAFVAIKVPFLSLGFPKSLPSSETLYQWHGLVFGSHVISAQLLLVWLTGALLGPRRGGLAMLFYLLLGLVGVPIFTNGGGVAYVLQPTFGYLAAFVPAVVVVGSLSDSPRFGRTWRGMFLGLMLIQLPGLFYELLVRGRLLSPASWWHLGKVQVLQFLPGQLVLLTAVAFSVALIRKLDHALLTSNRAKRDAAYGPLLPTRPSEPEPEGV